MFPQPVKSNSYGRFYRVLVHSTLLAASVSAFAVTAADIGKVPPSEQPVLRDIQKQINAQRLRQDVTKLVSFGTRHTLAETASETRGIGAARRWIKAEFERISTECGGCLEVMYQKRTFSGEKRIPNPTEVVNVIAIQRGITDPNRYIVMSGDIDSRVSDPLDFSSDSPGANDNATGVAGAIEAARVLSQHKFDGTIVYAALSGEEQGLFGGKIMADIAKQENWRVEAVINNDMIGNIAGINGVINNTTARVFSEGVRYVETPEEARLRRFTGGEVDSPSRNVARYIDKVADDYIPNLDVMMVYRLDRFGRGGHHRPFNEVGFPAVRIMETNEHYDRQHQDLRTENGREYGDVLAGVDFDFNAKLTSLNAVTLAAMAWAPAPPANVKIQGAVQPSTTLSWEKPTGKMAENLAGYRIHWRLTTEPRWTKSQYVGDVSEFTLENIVIDNYFFGVSSVAKDGFESPVVFPGPAGSFGGYE
ncbi:M20/M25/M40 family metallo-hydrolase [Thalassotalea euphylliae]|uniref:M20/M25/M40 family metallo-hydrolase n=1 Tax=Thalassotalea euphylliae TaxID=1655234 RepID=A0A3E0TVF6_9GAMM|nr:M28 family metallopeptidase [Thalassotalea euphylliae]REL27912.1 M20/M25/M40 family metallo-hydrolase [Thalassotalea euphylliae]